MENSYYNYYINASWSDRCISPKGRRMPFLESAALPLAMSTVISFTYIADKAIAYMLLFTAVSNVGAAAGTGYCVTAFIATGFCLLGGIVFPAYHELKINGIIQKE